jgi:hypothetical protein
MKILIPNSAVGTLTGNSSNVIQLIINAYNVVHLSKINLGEHIAQRK